VRSALFWDVPQRRLLVITDVSGQPKKNWTRPLKRGPIRCPETSVTNYNPTLFNIPEERRSRNSSVRTEVLCEKVGVFGVAAEIRAAASLVQVRAPAA
jgi:hypothetical protein